MPIIKHGAKWIPHCKNIQQLNSEFVPHETEQDLQAMKIHFFARLVCDVFVHCATFYCTVILPSQY